MNKSIPTELELPPPFPARDFTQEIKNLIEVKERLEANVRIEAEEAKLFGQELFQKKISAVYAMVAGAVLTVDYFTFAKDLLIKIAHEQWAIKNRNRFILKRKGDGTVIYDERRYANAKQDALKNIIAKHDEFEARLGKLTDIFDGDPDAQEMINLMFDRLSAAVSNIKIEVVDKVEENG